MDKSKPAWCREDTPEVSHKQTVAELKRIFNRMTETQEIIDASLALYTHGNEFDDRRALCASYEIDCLLREASSAINRL